jgi:hypothetical protein
VTAKQTPILIDDNEWAIFVDHGDASSQVIWKVVGPQNVENARRLAKAVLAATGGEADYDKPPPLKVEGKTRTVTAALREHLLAGTPEEDIWVAMKAEFNLGNDKRYRVREVKKELIKAGTLPADLV